MGSFHAIASEKQFEHGFPPFIFVDLFDFCVHICSPILNIFMFPFSELHFPSNFLTDLFVEGFARFFNNFEQFLFFLEKKTTFTVLTFNVQNAKKLHFCRILHF